jgi:hypothetical protein
LAGTVTVSEVAVAAVTVPLTGPKNTMLPAAVVLKPVPVMVIAVPGGPLTGEKLLIVGCAKTRLAKSTSSMLNILFLTIALYADSLGQMDIGFIRGL